MEVIKALDAFSALSHETRFWVFRLLVQAGADGMSAGDIAENLGARQNTMSTHLKILHQAGLLESRRLGRSVIYQANYAAVTRIIVFLMDDCCSSDPAVCLPLADKLAQKNSANGSVALRE